VQRDRSRLILGSVNSFLSEFETTLNHSKASFFRFR